MQPTTPTASAPAERPAMDDTRRLRSCLSRFASGVTAVTYDNNGAPRGTTVSSFISVSLDPALVLVSLDRRSRACAALPHQDFTVNVLSDQQKHLALHFAGQKTAPAAPVPWAPHQAVPRLEGTIAWFHCRPWRTYDGGDHLLVLGEIQRYASSPGQPLLYHNSTLYPSRLGSG